VIVLDENPDITIKADGFHAAYDELYSDNLEYYSSTGIAKVDTEKKVITSKMGEEFEFSSAAIYPHVRGHSILERAGVAKDSAFNKLEANIDQHMYNVIGDEYVYCAGDVRPMPFSKSGNTANTEGKVVAKIIADRMSGKKASWDSPHTTCYSLVKGDPMEGISVDADYAQDDKGNWGFHNAHADQTRKASAGMANLEWAKGIYRDLFM